MNPVIKIILKYSLAIFLLRSLVGIIIEFISLDMRIPFTLILFIPIVFLCWLLTYNGTIKLGRYIKGRKKLEYTGDLIIGIPILIDILLLFLFFKSFQGVTGSLLLLTICTLAAYRASKKVYSKS